jgi:ABC-2 type transport system ATP-binding protein
VRDIINSLRAEGTAVFLNSHLLSEVEQTCDRVAFIRDGQILQTTSLDELAQSDVEVTIRVGQQTPQLLTDLAEFGEDVRAGGKDGRIRLTLSHEDKIPPLARWLIANGHALYELSQRRLSLEDQFLQIVGGKGES